MKERVVNKVKQNVGFTFVELLTALLILVMISGVIAAGVPTAFHAYTAAVDSSNAQVALSTTTTAIRDEFGMAYDVKKVGGVVYYRSGDGYWASLSNPGAGYGVGLQKHVYRGDVTSGNVSDLVEMDGSPFPLIPNAAVTESLRVDFSSITYADGVFSVNDLSVSNKDGSVADTGTTDGSYKVRSIVSADV